jgi:hypothetical protein
MSAGMVALSQEKSFDSGRAALAQDKKEALKVRFFEMRTYTYAPGELPTMIKNWENAVGVRLQFGPVCAIWYSELGALSKFVHIWPYQTLDQRADIRKKSHDTGMWPSSVKAVKEGGRAEGLLAQENKIRMPSAFSPLQ